MVIMKIREIKAKRIIQKTNIPDADWVINPYVGCEHACRYCYARFVCRWRNTKDKWGEFVDVKVNAPELASKESKNKKGVVIFSTVCDPYQPIERKYRLTRKILQNLNPNMYVVILTKSDLVLRDIDVFKRFKNIEIGLTITTFDEKIRKIWEPKSPSSERRLKALKKLKQEGFSTYVFIAPIFPYLVNLEDVVKKVAPYVDVLMFEDLNINAAKQEIFSTLKEHFPQLVEKYKKLDKKFWLEKIKEIKTLGKKYKKPVEIYFKHVTW